MEGSLAALWTGAAFQQMGAAQLSFVTTRTQHRIVSRIAARLVATPHAEVASFVASVLLAKSSEFLLTLLTR